MHNAQNMEALRVGMQRSLRQSTTNAAIELWLPGQFVQQILHNSLHLCLYKMTALEELIACGNRMQCTGWAEHEEITLHNGGSPMKHISTWMAY
jgi:hypothetical protein